MFDANKFLEGVTQKPGIYLMYNLDEEIIYVGKAKNLKKRLSSYFRGVITNLKTKALVKNINKIEVIITLNEVDALILENDYIKQHKPRYNVLMRDDKSYPYIVITEHEYPRLAYHRGPKKLKGKYFGPFPSGLSVKQSLTTLKKLFNVRQCSDIFYKSRSRACLEYQIGNCTAPCINKVSVEDYKEQVRLTQLFLQGKDKLLIDNLIKRMEKASLELKFEKAVIYRDQISQLNNISNGQSIHSDKDKDILGISCTAGVACINIISLRKGQIFNSSNYYPKIPKQIEEEEIIRSFILQFYLNNTQSLIKEIWLPIRLEDKESISLAISKVSKEKFVIKDNIIGDNLKFIKLAKANAANGLEIRVNHSDLMNKRMRELEKILNCNTIKRMECFDISHTMGESTVASCVVFNENGPDKKEYRTYNINDITPGDDYGAMRQALIRRFKYEKIPEILVIDGGLGQLHIANEVLQKLESPPLLLSIAKGEGRKVGLETIYVGKDDTILTIASESKAFHLLTHIRDEAHRFAIKTHRNKRKKTKMTSTLESIEGIGPSRRNALLTHLGGLQGVKSATVDELMKIPGINKEIAQRVYNRLRE